MPRTFRRGKKIDATLLFQFFDRYLSETQSDLFVQESRRRFCPEPALEEQEIDQILEILKGVLRRLGLITEAINDVRVVGGFPSFFFVDIQEQRLNDSARDLQALISFLGRGRGTV